MSDAGSSGPQMPSSGGVRQAAPEYTRTLAIIAVIAGFAGLLMYRFVISDPILRYLIPLADVVAIALAVWLLSNAQRRRTGLDMALGALATAGVSLYLFLAYVTGPPPPPGGT